jgi:hypothetical protein
LCAASRSILDVVEVEGPLQYDVVYSCGGHCPGRP